MAIKKRIHYLVFLNELFGSAKRFCFILLSYLSKITIFLLVLMLRAWKMMISPYLGNHCRFIPTCSVYAINALQLHGLIAGGWLTVKRLVRCNPWCEGGEDPVPPK